MPKVPSYDNFTVTPNAPTVRVQDAISVEAAGLGGRKIMESAGQVEKVLTDQMKLQMDLQEQANILRVEDAKNQLNEYKLKLSYDKDAGYTSITGVTALQRESGKPLSDEYAELYKEQASQLAQKLGNDQQRMMFSEFATKDGQSFQAGVMRHETEQFKTYALSVREGTIASKINEIGLRYREPDVVDASIEAIKASAYDMARMQGKSGSWAQVQADEMVSKAHTSAITSALKNKDVEYAHSYFKKYGPSMNADDLLKAQGMVKDSLNGKLALDTAFDVVNSLANRIKTPEAERAFNIAIQAESSGRQFDKDGKPLTSPKGAIGIAQVMPDTAPEAAKLAGLDWDEGRYKNDAEYNKSLGKAYFNKQIRDFGNLPQAYAAYNAGPQRVKDAMAEAEKAGNKNGWLGLLPKETQDYVAKNVEAYADGYSGANKMPTLMEVKQAVRDRVGSDDPERLKLALDETEKHYKDALDSIKQDREGALGEAYRSVLTGSKYADLDIEIKSRLAPEDIKKVMSFAKDVAEGNDATTDWALYYRLKSNERQLSQTNLLAVKDKLSTSEFKELVNLQKSSMNGDRTALNKTRSVKDVLDQFMRQSGVDPSPKDDDPEGATKVGAVWQMFEQRVMQREALLGKPMSLMELREEAARMFIDVDVKGLWSSKKPYAIAMLDEKKIDIPEQDQTKIEAALKSIGLPVTEKNIEEMYLQGLGVR